MRAAIENGRLVGVFSRGAFYPLSLEELAKILDHRARREIARQFCR